MRRRSRLLTFSLTFGLILAVVGSLFLVLPRPASRARAQDRAQAKLAAQGSQAIRFAVSLPVNELPEAEPHDVTGELKSKPFDPIGKRATLPGEFPVNEAAKSEDPVVQSAAVPAAIGPPTLSFEGLGNIHNAQLSGFIFFPPDPVGDVGPNHYVQMVNNAFRIYDKSGNPLTPPRRLSDLFAPLGPPCGQANNGDPIVLYDPLADRWMLTQFCLPSNPPTTADPGRQVIAISKTSDPTGEYYLYDFILPGNRFQDYPHLGVWPDGYYMTANQFHGIVPTAVTRGAFAFDRQKMLRGDPTAGYIFIDLTDIAPDLAGMLPADLDGLRPPPLGTPNYFSAFQADEFGADFDGMRIFEFRADFANPANSSFTERPESPIPVAAFDARDSVGRNNIEQPPPAAVPCPELPAAQRVAPCYFLDNFQDRLMNRLAYRNFGTHESLVANHTVNVGIHPPANRLPTQAEHQAGVRYYELRRPLPGGDFGIHEQATHAPGAPDPVNGENRWMASAAQDGQGNIAVGYSVSGLTTFPSIRYAGRLATDPPGGLFQGEASLIEGTGSQRHASGRWGDYSALSVDPADDCTFWYTQEYYTREGSLQFSSNWQTRIGKFTLPGCTPVTTGTLQGTVTDCASGLPVANAFVEISGGFSRATVADGTFSARLLPGTYTVTVGAPGRPASPPQTITIAGGGSGTADFCLTAVSVVVVGRTSVTGESCAPTNNVINPGERLTVSVSLPNSGAAATSNLVATLLPGPGVISPSDPQNLGAIPAGGTGAATFSFTASGQCGEGIDLTFQLTDGTNNLGTITVPFRTGATTAVYAEDFDDVTAPGLPPGWTATLAAGRATDVAWRTMTGAADTPPNSVFAADYNHITDNRLTSPLIAIPAGGGLLTFRHRFDFEEFFDGGVLEISINGGPFTDILAAGGSFASGGYDTTLITGFGNPIGGRFAWTGNSFTFVTTVVNLPAAAAGRAVQLRWRAGTDSTNDIDGAGWFIDTVSIAVPVPFSLGTAQASFIENFDGVPAPALPAGWVATVAVGTPADAWRTTVAISDTPFNSAFAPGPGRVTDNRLTSPPIPITTAQAQLTFRNLYNFEGFFDGAVLEISINGGPFTDILTAGGSFASGGYTGTVFNPIFVRPAWTGFSGRFITTRVNLPAAAAGQTIRLRWRIATDELNPSGLGTTGQFIDTITITDGFTCAATCTPVRLVTTATLARDAGTGEVVATVTVTNDGTAAAINARLTLATLGGATGAGLPQSLGTIAPGASATATVRFPASTGAAGSRNLLRVEGVYEGGNFGSALRVTLP